MKCRMASDMLYMIIRKCPRSPAAANDHSLQKALQASHATRRCPMHPCITCAEDLWRLLEDVGIQSGPTARAHPAFGKPEDRVRAMVQKRCATQQRALELGRLPRLSSGTCVHLDCDSHPRDSRSCGTPPLRRRRYLREQKGRGGDQGKTYEWGANAEDEITRAKVDDFIRQVTPNQRWR